MKKFSEKALQSLNGYYVYALIDPRTDKVFYIGKGIGDRVFNHEIESNKSPDSEKIKLQTISSIEKAGLHVKRVIVNWGLTEGEAFAAEASLINLWNFTSEIKLSNMVAGHHVHESLTVEDFELRYGAEHLKEEDIKHNILVIKINRLFHWNMTPKELYDATRGNWVVSISRARREIDYVFAVYNQLIVAVYKPDEWHCVREMIDVPRPDEFKNGIDEKVAKRGYFISKSHETLDDNQQFYLHKSIAELAVNQSAQNPITYLMPKRELTVLPTESILARQSDSENNIYEEPDKAHVHTIAPSVPKSCTNETFGSTNAEFYNFKFWTKFNEYAFKNPVFCAEFRMCKPTGKHWCNFRIGISGCHISATHLRDRLCVELYIPDDKALFDYFFLHKTAIEHIIGRALDWRRLPEKKASRILIATTQFDMTNEFLYEKEFDWIVENALNFKRAFTSVFM